MVKNITKGIYCFIDEETGIVVYIGRFTGRKRIKEHYYPSRYDDQSFNRVLQSNPDRYRVEIICEYPDLTDDELNYLEIKEILKHKFLYDEIPRFNFTIGGEGVSGYIHTEEAKKKISDSRKGENHPMFNKHYSEKTKEKMSESHTKPYARIIKKGFDNGKQVYAIMFNGEVYKRSIYPDKLAKWFEKNYPDEILMEG